MAGYRVQEAANLDEAVREMELQSTDVVVAAVDLPPKGGSALASIMRARPGWERIPLLGLADSAGQLQSSAVRTAGFEDCQAKFDGLAILEAVARLAPAGASPINAPACVGEEK
jgi:CheY-like chemotaxis protein